MRTQTLVSTLPTPPSLMPVSIKRWDQSGQCSPSQPQDMSASPPPWYWPIRRQDQPIRTLLQHWLKSDFIASTRDTYLRCNSFCHIQLPGCDNFRSLQLNKILWNWNVFIFSSFQHTALSLQLIQRQKKNKGRGIMLRYETKELKECEISKLIMVLKNS